MTRARDQRIVIVGSTNPNKLAAVRAELDDGEDVHRYLGVDVDSGVSEQPDTLSLTILGATNRAWAALRESPTARWRTIAVGLESGVISISTGQYVLDLCACVILHPRVADGTDRAVCVGLSSAFEVPPVVAAELGTDARITLTGAAIRVGLTKDKDLGKRTGLVGLLSGDRLTRKDQCRQAVAAAMVHVHAALTGKWRRQ